MRDDDPAEITGEWQRDLETPADAPVERQFLRSLRDRPDDLAMRIVFADWLEERGESRKALVVRLLAEPPAEDTPAYFELQTASDGLDAKWLATVSRAPIEKCAVQFKFKCPLVWDALAVTYSPSVRHCNTCERGVHFCATLDEVREHGRHGNCVAFSPALLRQEAIGTYEDRDEELWMGDINVDEPPITDQMKAVGPDD